MTTIVTIRTGSKPVTVDALDPNFAGIVQHVVRPESSIELTLHDMQPILTVVEVADEDVPSPNYFTTAQLEEELRRRREAQPA